MKKVFVMLLVLLSVMSTVVCAANFDDTRGMNCEYAVDRIEYLGIVNGTGGNKFEPQKAVTRAELSKMITSIIAKEKGTSNKDFSDINGHWGKEYILKAASIGILNGYSDGTFKPDMNVSYAEAIAIILRCMGYSNLEATSSSVWYENYISMMKEIGLDSKLDEFDANTYASRGDIAILLWNMLVSDFRVDKIKDGSYTYDSKTMLEEYFPNLNYWDDVKIMNITSYNGKVLYVTSNGNFYVEENIDFSDLGGLVSGFYDSKYNIIIGMCIDEKVNSKKLSGSLKSMTEAGYEVLTCDNIAGYGDKVYAEYVEIFVDEETNKVLRVVFYDTRESHFAEKIKIGDSRVTIESRDVYDQSIVQLKDGKTITYNILRTESVMDVSINALLVHAGKVVEWKEVPADSVIREIEKGVLYTYVHKFVDGKIATGKINFRTLKMNGKEYDVVEDCICQNIETKQTMKLKEGLTREDITKLGEVDENVRIYLNEFDEIVKLEFSYDIWKMHELEEREEEYQRLKVNLNNIGFIVDSSSGFDEEGNEKETTVKLLALPKERNKSFAVNDSSFKIGDLVYCPSGEQKLKEVTDRLKIDSMQVIMNYTYPINENKIGNYLIGEDTQIVEVLLTKDEKNNNLYSKCVLNEKTVDELFDYTRYRSVHLIVNENGNVIRLYVLREVGVSINIGIVRDIKETISGDKYVGTTVFLINDKKLTKKYNSTPIMGYSIGDIVTFDVKAKATNEKNDKLVVNEVYRHENIGSKYDLIVKKYNDGIVTFKNLDLIIDLKEEYFEYNDKVYYFDDYTFVNVEVARDAETDEWLFKQFSVSNNKNKFKLEAGYRIAIDEITGTIIAYKGYKE